MSEVELINWIKKYLESLNPDVEDLTEPLKRIYKMIERYENGK